MVVGDVTKSKALKSMEHYFDEIKLVSLYYYITLCVIVIGLHRFQILPILQVPSTAIKCIYKYKYQYWYMKALHCLQS